MGMFEFNIIKKSETSSARTAVFLTPHGKIETPAFVPVATKGALKGTDFDCAINSGSQIFMMNTFHFFCNGRYKDVARLGGLHRFIGCEVPIMTDSGGFQVFSLGSGWEQGVGKLTKNGATKTFGKSKVLIDDDGVIFTSPVDGSKLRMTPEISIEVQEALGADIIFAFDECTSPLVDYEYTKRSLERTHNWASRCIKVFKGEGQVIFGIVQGGPYPELRRESAKVIGDLPFFGFGIGGSFGGSYGDSKKSMHTILEETLPLLPETKPRHLLGIGEMDDILEAVDRGIDLFDCVIPIRWARHGVAMTDKGRINMKQAKFLKNEGMIDENCECRVCQNYSSAYICHLLRESEIYGISLLAEHNLSWILNLMKDIRFSINEGSFTKFKAKKLSSRFLIG